MNKRQLVKFYKRAALAFVLLIPIFVMLDQILGATSDMTKISIFVLVGIIVIGMVELIRYKKKC